MTTTILDTDKNVTEIAEWVLFSRERPDGSTFYYSVPAGFAFVLQEGVPNDKMTDKFRIFTDMALRGGCRFRMRIGPEKDEDLKNAF